MALGWLAILKTVPWTDVISAAPQLAGSARSLWDAVANKPPSKLAHTTDVDSTQARIAVRIDQTEAGLAAMQAQMLSASDIIKSLADQNTLMVAKIELLRMRLLWLCAATVTALIIAIGSLVVVIK
ncbi:hypothetical protein ACHMW6_28885 [Pseudoduganella sp. UC29_106]|uniref:hypothetical protein n=1 Tax=Pseudoduganella sp. UC29_106 TaxID=3374553 RepID=UPI0037580922